MIVEGSHSFAAPPESVWPLLLDPEVIGRAMPGARELALVEPGKYRGSLKVAVGPITAAEFALGIAIENPEAPKQFDMIVDANGKFGFTRGKAHVSLLGEDGGTRMAYRAELQVGGKLAPEHFHLERRAHQAADAGVGGKFAKAGDLVGRRGGDADLAEPGRVGRGQDRDAEQKEIRIGLLLGRDRGAHHLAAA